MLPDFLLPVRLDGEKFDLIARDVPAHVFFYGYPHIEQAEDWTDREPEEIGFRVITSAPQTLTWLLRMLANVVVWPHLKMTDVYRLGLDANMAAAIYCRTIGWFERGSPQDHIFLRSLGLHAENMPRVRQAPRRPHYRLRSVLKTAITSPERTIRELLHGMTMRANIAPSTAWKMPISEFVFTLRRLKEQQEAQQGPTQSTGGYGEIVP